MEEQSAIVQREPNAKQWDYYELVWRTGTAQSDAVCLLAEDINWNTRTISYLRKKLESRAPMELNCGDGV